MCYFILKENGFISFLFDTVRMNLIKIFFTDGTMVWLPSSVYMMKQRHYVVVIQSTLLITFKLNFVFSSQQFMYSSNIMRKFTQ